ncbi:alpha-2B adrenergic receptor-like [Octopus vulgaris]|uniref:Alpha-2B adrenergic receptor-like n=1 Tax=Octopus vulgaris TaxID=6645 RepID=A0AA36BBV7_OCTVU|nr:alpha-2B adrenergic receptor-like [Octopus vulgaris]
MTTENYINSSTTLAPGPSAEAVREGIVLIIICLFAFFGNTLLCTVILRTRSLRNSSTYLILCLSISDIVVTVVNMPLTIYSIFKGTWPFTNDDCIAVGYINMVSFIASVMSLTAISLNRYFRICRSLHFKSMFTFKKTMMMAFVVWLVSCLLAAPPLFGWSEYGYLGSQSFCFCKWKTSTSYTFFMIGMCFCVPCIVMSFCYVRIITSVRNSNRRLMSLDQRLSASYVDMESENQKVESPTPILRDTASEPERLRNGTLVHVDPLCVKKLTDYATTLRQNLALQQKQNNANSDCGSPEFSESDKCPRCQDPSLHPVKEDYTVYSDSDDNVNITTQFTNGIPLTKRNMSCETILNVSSPETQSPNSQSPTVQSPTPKSRTLPASINHIAETQFPASHSSFNHSSSDIHSPVIRSSASSSPVARSPETSRHHTASDGICENGSVVNVKSDDEVNEEKPRLTESDTASQDSVTIQSDGDVEEPVTFSFADNDEVNCENEDGDSEECNENPGDSSPDSSSELINDRSSVTGCTEKTTNPKKMDETKRNCDGGEQSETDKRENCKETIDDGSMNRNDMSFSPHDGPGSLDKKCTCWSKVNDSETSKSCSVLNNSFDNKLDSPPADTKRHETVTERPTTTTKKRQLNGSRYNLRKIFSLPSMKVPLENNSPRKPPSLVPMKHIRNSAEGRKMRVKMSNVTKSRKFVKSQNNIKKALSLPRMRMSAESSRKSSSSVIPLRHLRRRREEIRITFSLLVVIIVFFVSWLPFCITMLCSLYLKYEVPREADIASLFCGYANSCFNPLIYGLMNKRFSDAYKDLFKFLFYRKCTKK